MKLENIVFAFKAIKATSELAYLLGYKIGLKVQKK